MSYPFTIHSSQPASDWTAQNPTLAQFQVGIESDTGKAKIGPGAWNSLRYWNPTSGNVKMYRGLLTQTGTNDPVATVLENSIGAIVWTRDNAGIYYGTLAGVFTAGKTFATSVARSLANGGDVWFTGIDVSNPDAVQVTSGRWHWEDASTNSLALNDDLLDATPIEILVYP